jgi:polar amino acid transport system permease protein
VLVTLLIFNGAYLSQVLRAGIRAVPPGQTQAAQALGLGYLATLRLVVLPQALRNVVPSIVSQLVLLIKETALGAVIGMTELMQQFMELADRHHEHTLQIYLLLGVSYFLLCYPLALAGRRLETQRNPAKP